MTTQRFDLVDWLQIHLNIPCNDNHGFTATNDNKDIISILNDKGIVR